MPLHPLVQELIFPISKIMPTEILMRPNILPTIREAKGTLMFQTLDYHMITWHKNSVIIKIAMHTIIRMKVRLSPRKDPI